MPARSGSDRVHPQTVLPRELFRRPMPVPADLGGEEAARRQKAGQFGGDRAIRGQPVGAAVERPDRVVLPHLGRQAGDSGALDIRGIGDHRVEPAGQCRGPASDDKLRPRADAEPLGVVARRPGGARRDIDPDAARCRDTRTAAPAAGTRCRCRDRENGRRRSRSGNRASTASTTVSLSGRGSSVSADSRNSRPQNSRRPTIRLSGSRASIRSSIAETRACCARGQQAFRMREDFGRGQVERRREQRPGAPPRLVDPGLVAQGATSGDVSSAAPTGERSLGTHASRHPSTVASLAARSAAVSASMISSSASPDMILSIL